MGSVFGPAHDPREQEWRLAQGDYNWIQDQIQNTRNSVPDIGTPTIFEKDFEADP